MIMTAWVIVFFLVYSNTFEGARAVNRHFIEAARLTGASSWQVTWTLIAPGGTCRPTCCARSRAARRRDDG